MANLPSNFDNEIKKGMGAAKSQQKGTSTSTNAVPDKQPKNNAKFNGAPKPSPAQPTDTSGSDAQPTNTHQAMLDAGQAHMAAIHAHINSMKGM